MKRRNDIIASLLAAVLFAVMPLMALAQQASVANDLGSQISGLNTDVQQKKNQLQSISNRIQTFQQTIAQKQVQSASLEDQLALLDDQVAQSQLDIDVANDQLKALDLQIGAIDAQMGDQEQQIARERELLGALARKLYRIGFRRSLFEILVSQRSFTGFFDALQSIVELQDGVDKTLAKVQTLRQQLEDERADRQNKELAVGEQKRQLDIAQRELEDERAVKAALLEETQSSAQHFRYLLADLKHQQDQADSEITYLERTLRDKLDLADRLRSGSAVISWPLIPTRGISTKFHDPDYPFRYVFEHPGIDIRAAQGTPVRAAAAGVIARAKNGGMGYSYVLIMHNNGISTVYGHLSRIVAVEDSFVQRGEIIGYSGGMPGTPGAGPLTTGPHLHFETRLHGVPVDPMKYLVSL